MQELGWTLLAVFGLMLILFAFVGYRRYCCMQEEDDLDEEEDREH